jgi:hypothetical protein
MTIRKKATMNVAIKSMIAGRALAVHMKSFRVRAFDPGKAGWKLSEDGKTIEMKDGNPIWIDANNGEATLAHDAITRLNGEAKTLRQRAETAEASLVPFKDIDPAAAKKAIELTKNIDAKKLIDAGEVEKLKNDIKAEFNSQLTELTTSNQKLTTDYNDLRVNSVFAQSDFIRDNIAVPRDMFEASFRNNFKIVDGNIQVFDKSGNRVMSKAKLGEHAEPEEALQILVDQHPQKATILKANQNSGGGNNGGGGHRPGNRTVTRAAFEALTPAERAHTAAEAGKGTVTIVD